MRSSTSAALSASSTCSSADWARPPCGVSVRVHYWPGLADPSHGDRFDADSHVVEASLPTPFGGTPPQAPASSCSFLRQLPASSYSFLLARWTRKSPGQGDACLVALVLALLVGPISPTRSGVFDRPTPGLEAT
jgi:hypothetical protein